MARLTEHQAANLDRKLNDIRSEYNLDLPMYFYFSLISSSPAIVEFSKHNRLPEAAKEQVKVAIKETYQIWSAL